MSISVQWDDDAHTIILWTFDGRLTWDDFDRASAATSAMYATVDHLVDMIYDIRKATLIPANVVAYFRREFPAKHPSTGLYVIVGADGFIQLLWTTFTTLISPHLKAHFCPTPDAARAFILQQR